ncbi:MAG: zinc-binding alcohol dehydrogenase family protein, partial [Gammaproteobacteria bacterium]|nr:zinc-binding alcohol dehydrogenase family protein [Gammaproteobacteria bacterium]
MKAIGYSEQGPVTAKGAVVEFETDKPTPEPNDLVVEVKAVSVNPVDFKVRANRPPPEGDPRILGWDAA